MVVSLTNAVNYPILLPRPSLVQGPVAEPNTDELRAAFAAIKREGALGAGNDGELAPG